MELATKNRIEKGKHATYSPKTVVEGVDLTEGMRVIINEEGVKTASDSLPDPITLALHGEKFATVSLEGLEAISREEQSGITGDSS